MKHIVRAVAFALVIGGCVTPLAAQTGTLRGTVSDSSGTPLPNASVTVEGTELRATTATQGTYEIRGVPAGLHTVRVRLIGYQAASARVSRAKPVRISRWVEALSS